MSGLEELPAERTEPWYRSHYVRAALIASVVLAIPSLRVGMWNAEWCTLDLCSGSWSECVAKWWSDQSPPAYYVGIWTLFRCVPPGAVAVRLPSLCAHLVSLVLLYQYTQRFHGQRIAALATLALSVNPTMLWFSTTGRAFAFFVPLTLTLIWAYREGRWRLFTLNAVLLVWLHYVMVPLLGFLWIWDAATTRKVNGPATRSLAVAVVCCLPLLVHILGDRIKTFELYREFDLSTGFLAAKWWFGLEAWHPAAVMLISMLLGIGLLHQARHCALETWLALAPLASAAAYSALIYPAFHPKFLLWTLPLIQVSVASLFARSRFWPLGWVWIVMIALGSLQAAGQERSSDLQGALDLAARFARHDRVLTSNLAEPEPHWRLEEALRRLPRTGSGPPSTWLLQGKPEDRHDYRVLTIAGIASTPPTSWTRLAPVKVLLEPER